MRDKEIREGLADLAGRAEADHEVQMARADLYKIAKYAIKLHDMLKGVSEAEGLEGWQQAKITKAADYVSSVYHNLDYDMKFGEGMNEAKQGYCSDDCCGADVKAEDCTCAPTCKHCDCNAVKEGKSPHKKGTKKYKKHMAAMHAGMESIEEKLQRAVAKEIARESSEVCSECGNARAADGSSYVAEKQRLDPKCWKGKKIGNPKTKMKGGVRVNNCVPAQKNEELDFGKMWSSFKNSPQDNFPRYIKFARKKMFYLPDDGIRKQLKIKFPSIMPVDIERVIKRVQALRADRS